MLFMLYLYKSNYITTEYNAYIIIPMTNGHELMCYKVCDQNENSILDRVIERCHNGTFETMPGDV